MSYEEGDAAYDRLIDEISASIYPEHRKRAIDEFTTECLQRVYLAHPTILEAPLRLLNEARKLFPNNPTAALVFAAAATETGLKSALLRPIINGLVHKESIADVLSTSLIGGATNLERLQKILVPVLAEQAAVDVRNFKRPGSVRSLWEEIISVQESRNKILHRGEFARDREARIAISVAEFVLESLFPRVLRNLELHLHDIFICSVPGLRVCPDKPKAWVQPRPLRPPLTRPAPRSLPELRDFIRSRRAALFGFMEQGAELELSKDILVVRPKNNIYIRYLTDNKNVIGDLASELYGRKITTQIAR